MRIIYMGTPEFAAIALSAIVKGTLLQDDYDSYAACLEQPMHHGIRINTMKISVEEFLKINPFHLRPVPWCHTPSLLLRIVII